MSTWSICVSKFCHILAPGTLLCYLCGSRVRFRPKYRGWLLCLLLAQCGCWGVGNAFSADLSQTPAAEAFELLRKLGLPDCAGAKWVRVTMQDTDSGSPQILERRELPGGNGQISYSGNAWLIREKAEGTVEIVTNQCRLILARRESQDPAAESPEPAEPTKSKLPLVAIAEANLQGDLALLEKAIQPRESAEGDSEFAEAIGLSVLFLANVYHEGEQEAATRLLPVALAASEKPGMALDQAISILADGRLSALNQRWLEGLPAADYADALQAIATEFPRGWRARKRALAFAEKARKQTPTESADDPESKVIAELILRANTEQIAEIRQVQNWLLPAPAEASTQNDGDDAGEPNVGAPDLNQNAPDRDDSAASDDAPAASATKGGYFASVLEGKHRSACALARLLGDHRLLRVLEEQGYDNEADSGGDEGDVEEENASSDRYAPFAHPLELSEVVERFLRPILPVQVTSQFNYESIPTKRIPMVSAWLQEIGPLSDEELAWKYLRTAGSSTDLNFLRALRFLVDHGSAETQSKLRDVFLDPAVWRGAFEYLAPALAKYLKQSGAGSPQFSASVLQAAKEALQEATANYGDKKEGEKRAAAKLAELQQALNPRPLADLLTDFEATPADGSSPILLAIGQELQTAPRLEAESQIYRAAAKAADPAARIALLGALNRAASVWRRALGKTPSLVPVPKDPETRTALETLLDDRRSNLNNHGAAAYGTVDQTVSNFTAMLFAWDRLPRGQLTQWMRLGSERVCELWMESFAREVVAGRAAPPFPNPSLVAPERIESLIAELGALSPEKVIPTLHERSINEQLAVMKSLASRADWPAALQSAQLVITQVQVDADVGLALDLTLWKGRTVNRDLARELMALAEKAALAGHGAWFYVATSEPLGGMKLSLRDQKEKPDGGLRLPGIEAGKKPDAYSVCIIQDLSEGQFDNTIAFAHPAWKDAALTTAWQEKYAKTNPNADPKEKSPRNRSMSVDPGALESRLDGLAKSAEAHSRFVLMVASVPMEGSNSTP